MSSATEALQPTTFGADGWTEQSDAISLSLSDLLPDSGGAIVIEGEGSNLSVRIVSESSVVEAGIVDILVTAAGEDVSGHAYFAFDNGTTLYAPRELDLAIVALTS